MSRTKKKRKKCRPLWGCLPIARNAIKLWNVSPVAALRCVCFGENATWRIKTESSVYALRIYRPGRWTDSQIIIEHDLMEQLGSKFNVDAPVAGRNGETLQSVPGTKYRAALFPWVSGRLFFGKPSKKQLNRLGSYLGNMHCHMLRSDSEREKPPLNSGGAHRPERVWDDETLLWQPLRATREVWPTLEMEEPFPEKLVSLAQRFHSCWKRLAPLTAIVHADLHLGNLKWSSSGLRPIDFDDCGVAPLAYDLAIPCSCYYGGKTSEEMLLNFLSGYDETGPRPISLAELTLFIGVRKIWMFGWCAERPEIYGRDLLRSRYKAFIKQLDRFENFKL